MAGKIGDLLARDDLIVVHTRSGTHIEELVRDARPEVVICRPDEELEDGTKVYEVARRTEQVSQCILLVEHGELRHAQELALDSKVFDYFVIRPAHDALRLEVSVRQAVREKRLRDENAQWERTFSLFRQEGLAQHIQTHRDGMIEDLRVEVDRFRAGIVPSEGEGGIVVVTDPQAFESHFLEFRDNAVRETVCRNASQVQSDLHESLGQVAREAKEALVLTIEERLARIPPKLALLKRATARSVEGRRRVLLVACGLPNLASVAEYLAGAGYEARTCDVLDSEEISLHGAKYDIVIVDVTGLEPPYDVVGHLRELLGSRCGIVAASTKVTNTMVKTCKEAGANTIILLPPRPASLEAKLSELLKSALSREGQD